jgi:hypothetical protein
MQRSTLLLLMAAFIPAAAIAETGHECPLAGKAPSNAAHDCPLAAGKAPATGHGHAADVARRGEKGMGFSQERTTHHFLLSSDGGSIQVTANDPADAVSRDQIRAHIAHIREMFAGGDFSIPMFVHDTTPPGVSTMKRRASSIGYSYEDLPGGGRVLISTADADARDAIHDFLRFQIQEHGTGDPTTVR